MKQYQTKILRTCLVLTCLSIFGLFFVSAQESGKKDKPFGFVSRMPQDTEVIFGMRNLEQFADEIGQSRTWKQLVEMFESESGIELSDAAEPWGSAMDFIGEDVFFGFGKGTADQLNKLSELSSVYNDLSYKIAGSQMLSAFGIGGGGDVDPEKMMRELIQELFKAEDGKFLKSMEELQLPAFIAGAKVEKGMAGQLLQQLAGLEAELPPMVLTSEFDVAAGGKFHSWSVAAKDVFDDDAREQMHEAIGDKDLSAKIEKIIDTKKVELSFGEVNGYLILGLGPDHQHIKFAENEADSLLAISDFEFAKRYGDKKILAYNYLAKSVLSSLYRQNNFLAFADQVGEIIESMKEGGIDFTKVIPLIKKFGQQVTKASEITVDSTAGVLYREDGLKWASVGGYTVPGIDVAAPLHLSGAAPKDAFLLVNVAEEAKSRAQGIEIIETVAEIIHVIGPDVVKLQGDEDMAQVFAQFDQMLTPKLRKVWGIMRDKVAKGLGLEGGLVIDLKGSMPKVPGIPAALIKNGKLPRVAMFNSVRDRKLLAESWTELVPAINEIAAVVPGQEPGQEFQIPDALSSDGKNVTTHFMGLPFVSNDFLPSLSINDELFFLSTSKKFTEEIAASIVESKEEKLTGIVLRVRFDALTSYAEDWLKLVQENQEDLFGDNGPGEDEFTEIANSIRKALTFAGGIKSLDYRRYKENRWRTDWHLEVTDIK